MKTLLAALIRFILAQVAQNANLYAGDWPMFRHDAEHTGLLMRLLSYRLIWYGNTKQ